MNPNVGEMGMDDSSDSLVPKYKRVLLKLSGESFGTPGKTGINIAETIAIARQIKNIASQGVELAIVIGGGNLLRGSQFTSGEIIKKTTADYMGMLATVMNGLTLQDSLEHLNCQTRLLSAVRMDSVAEPYIRRRAVRHLEKGRIVILAGGTGNPYVTTDTAAALRGIEISAEALLKATKVDGVYSDDPEKNPHAVRYEKLSYAQALRDNLRVMDVSAISLCQDAKLPIVVFDFKREGNIERAIAGHKVGTTVS